MATRRRWCGWCMVAGVALFVWGISDALAQTATHSSGPTWETWFALSAGAISMLVSAFAAGLSKRLDRAEAVTAAMQRALDRDYHTKSDTDKRFDRIDQSVSALHRRLDFLRVPQATQRPAPYQDDGA
jgi:hypothetical protein